MIDLHTWYTANGRKISIALEELEIPYRVYPVDINQGEQFAPDFLKLSPNGKIPAIVDHDVRGRTLMESGAILMYLAEKAGRLLPKDDEKRWRTLEWLFWQVGGVGPMLGQHMHFTAYKPEASSYGRERYATEAHRLYGVLDRRLAEHEYIVDEYSIADIAVWPWISRYELQLVDLDAFPHVRNWYREIAQRPAVQRGWRVPDNDQPLPVPGKVS